jgi:hypothetical protein
MVDEWICEEISQLMEGLMDKQLDSWIHCRRDKMELDWLERWNNT